MHTVSGVTTIEQIKTIIGQEILVGTFPLFPLIATGMLLTAAGIYGVLAFAVSRRATELAVRIAVGATGRDLLRLVAAHSLRMLGIGSAIGIALTFALTRVAQGRGGVFDSPRLAGIRRAAAPHSRHRHDRHADSNAPGVEDQPDRLAANDVNRRTGVIDRSSAPFACRSCGR